MWKAFEIPYLGEDFDKKIVFDIYISLHLTAQVLA